MALITLRVLDGADRGRVFASLPTPVTIGREEGNTLQLNDERVSRFHLKIQEDQDKLVLTDLESTNGTRVNGEDIQLRVLRHGDLIFVGRSVLLFGSREEIAERLATLRGASDKQPGEGGEDADASSSNLEYELNWTDNPQSGVSFRASEPPELPQKLSPLQAAQLSEILEYVHMRIRDLLASVRVMPQNGRITLDERQWQSLIDIQIRLAEYRRHIGEPSDDD
ncbi:MAG TPA: FHA domain-containing protein [Pirellulales bacterium]|jgi:predicted component of type VI protein secretion system|nr:FHA domain-containing protein [Pirellulales bacterium]